MADWEVKDQEYRIVVKTPGGIKTIYTNELNICTGLGPARNILAGSMLTPIQFERLNQFDPRKNSHRLLMAINLFWHLRKNAVPPQEKLLFMGAVELLQLVIEKGFSDMISIRNIWSLMKKSKKFGGLGSKTI